MILPITKATTDAAMFDIDDTLIASDTGKVIEDVYNLYKSVQKKGYKMVIITARPGFYENVIWTQNQLRDIDITYDELIFTPPPSKSLYKRESKYNYILSVGDMDTDLTDSKYSVKVSNASRTRDM
jgi:ribonucleotide monophosphatase NagD (HAD superfamily)|tara:strand:- start:1628 stop:2005 length:378 start_codon:yes stop_codon:yes gene_type:complete